MEGLPLQDSFTVCVCVCVCMCVCVCVCATLPVLLALLGVKHAVHSQAFLQLLSQTGILHIVRTDGAASQERSKEKSGGV